MLELRFDRHATEEPAMLRSVNEIHDSRINASDDQIGHVKEAYFDDEAWTIRYLVVDTGNWLTGRKVLISPYSIRTPLTEGNLIDVDLTREQVRNSPDIDTHKPVSRRHERDYLTYYGYPSYWEMGGVWGGMEYPLFPYVEDLKDDVRKAEHERDPRPVSASESVEDDEDSHLRSTADVTGYDIQASDGSIGHVEDFIFDEESWTIRYLVVDTVNWWPGGKRVLIATRWIDHIDWAQRKVVTSLSRDGVKDSPDYDPDALLDRQYEQRLHAAHRRGGYWE
jgi:sporulation protein YlmC with PRC-barrel domain